jgi:inner membrane transporter RhtA
MVSAVFHYLGPTFAVLLFPATGVLGVAWFRIVSAALVFAPITRPWLTVKRATWTDRALLVALGICLAAMNCAFYLALERLPISLVAALEFVGTIGIAFIGLRSRRNLLAILMVGAGALLLIDVVWVSDPLGLFWAFLNAALFVVYVVIGHKIASRGAGQGVELLGGAMLIAAIVILPIGLDDVLSVLSDPLLVMAGIGVGISSSVIPYVCDQLAMARLPRASFALLLAILPASATIIGAIVLSQFPSLRDLFGIGLIMIGVAVHEPAKRT